MASASALGRRRACLARALDARGGGDEVWAGFSRLGCPSRTVGIGAVVVLSGA